MPHLIRIGSHTDLNFHCIRSIAFRLSPEGDDRPQVPVAAVVNVMHHSSFVTGGLDALMLLQYIHGCLYEQFFWYQARESFPVESGRPERVDAVVVTYYNMDTVCSAHYKNDANGSVLSAILAWPDGRTAQFEGDDGQRLREHMGRRVESRLTPSQATRQHYEANYGNCFPTFAPAGNPPRETPGSEPHLIDYGEPRPADTEEGG